MRSRLERVGEMWMGEQHPSPLDALEPKKCKCEKPVYVTEEDGEKRCFWCSCPPRRRP